MLSHTLFQIFWHHIFFKIMIIIMIQSSSTKALLLSCIFKLMKNKYGNKLNAVLIWANQTSIICLIIKDIPTEKYSSNRVKKNKKT